MFEEEHSLHGQKKMLKKKLNCFRSETKNVEQYREWEQQQQSGRPHILFIHLIFKLHSCKSYRWCRAKAHGHVGRRASLSAKSIVQRPAHKPCCKWPDLGPPLAWLAPPKKHHLCSHFGRPNPASTMALVFVGIFVVFPVSATLCSWILLCLFHLTTKA